MQYVEAFSLTSPSHYTPRIGEVSLFLGGGISNCPDWQKEMAEMLQDTSYTIINPRRKNFPMNDPSASEKQIVWEFDHLQKSSMIMFWFPKETLCPITLFEYGKWIGRNRPLFVGCHPEYPRLIDVQVQTALERPNQVVHTDLMQLAQEIKTFRYTRSYFVNL